MPWKYCGYIHRVEEYLRIPYRYYKCFPGTWSIDGGEAWPCRPVMYVRPFNMRPVYNRDEIVAVMQRMNAERTSSNSEIPLKSGPAPALLAASVEILDADPYAWLINRDEIERWVEEDKEAELAALREEEKVAP